MYVWFALMLMSKASTSWKSIFGLEEEAAFRAKCIPPIPLKNSRQRIFGSGIGGLGTWEKEGMPLQKMQRDHCTDVMEHCKKEN